MTLADRIAIPLDIAHFCESCRAVVNDATCCLCASAEHTYRLAAWLDRDEAPLTIQRGGVVITISTESGNVLTGTLSAGRGNVT